ncbi:MAG: hypothetical protein ACTHM2_05775 [Afipia sp.]|jgi:hypothetical protein
MAVGSASAFALLLALLWPSARSAGEVLLSQDDPSRLSDVRLGFVLRNDPALLERNIVAALEAGDSDLARSFADLADRKGIAVSPEVTERVVAATANERAPSHVARNFITGFVTGEVTDGASLSGTVAGDLSVFGDIRDMVREGKRLATGEEADRLVLGLASIGLAVTAATYVSAGGAAPVRAGLTMVKDARKVGRLGAGLTEWAGRSARAVVDGPALRTAVTNASLTHPRQTVTALKAAFRAEKAGALVRLAKDVGRVGEKAGTRGALDVLRISDGPKDVARAARLAGKKGSQTRAIIKILGRGALLLTAGAFNLAWWVFGALLTLFGFLASIKATTERATLAVLHRRKRKRLARQLALTPAPSA